jgi:hypothetical protein
LLQLKPVFDDWIFNDRDKGITALAPNIWKDLFSTHELTEIMACTVSKAITLTLCVFNCAMHCRLKLSAGLFSTNRWGTELG